MALLGNPLRGLDFGAVLARAAVNLNSVEHTELRSGRFLNVSRRDTSHGGEVVLLTDVTEAHLMHVFLARQQRLITLGEIAAGLAHQIRTPLATALLYASQMTLPGRKPADVSRCAERTVSSLKQLERLVHDMLAFAHGGGAREAVSVSALLGASGTVATPGPAQRRLPDHPHASASAHGAGECGVARLGGSESCHQRAAGCARQAPSRALRAPRRPRRAQILVGDDGPGVPAHIRERIFEPFFTTRARGNGIGLAIVKSVVEAHRGRVYLADAEPGATFVIDLPAEEPA